jgi:hypothetical protein
MTVSLDYPTHRTLLQFLLELRFATTEQLARITASDYGSRRSAIRQTTRHLTTLKNHGLVLRLERRVGGWQGGSAPAIWALTTSGHRAITERGRGRQRPQLISTTFLEHLLAIAESRIIAAETVRTITDASLTVQTEPACWRSYLGPHGQQLTLRPDLHLATTTLKYTDSYFVEVDRATENPARVIATCWQYVRYRRMGTEQKACGAFPAVLWIVPTEKRREQLQTHIAAAELPAGMFHVLTLTDLPEVIHDGPPLTNQNNNIT